MAGGGPAGCALAAKVAAAGPRVLLLEKSREPGWGRDWIVDVERSAFEEAGVPSPGRKATWHEPESQVMMSPVTGARIELLPAPVVPVRNGAYVKQLAGWAAESGVEIRTGCPVLGPVCEEGRVAGVRYRSGEGEMVAQSDLVADCTGLTGAIRRKTPPDWDLNGDLDPRDVILARREVRAVDVTAAASRVERGDLLDGVRVDRTGVMSAYSVETCHLDLDAGYIDILVGGKLGGRFPTADEWFNRILARWPFIGEKQFGGGAAIPIRRTWDSLVGDGLLLLGDSACQVIPMHGSGTASALLSADLAAGTVVRAIEEGRYEREALWEYCHRFQSGRGSVLAFFFVVQRHTDNLSGDDIDKLITRGIITAEDFYNGLVPLPFQDDPLALAGKVARGLPMLPLLIGFGLAGFNAVRMMKHYQQYPRTYDRETLDRWIAGLPRPG